MFVSTYLSNKHKNAYIPWEKCILNFGVHRDFYTSTTLSIKDAYVYSENFILNDLPCRRLYTSTEHFIKNA